MKQFFGLWFRVVSPAIYVLDCSRPLTCEFDGSRWWLRGRDESGRVEVDFQSRDQAMITLAMAMKEKVA